MSYHYNFNFAQLISLQVIDSDSVLLFLQFEIFMGALPGQKPLKNF